MQTNVGLDFPQSILNKEQEYAEADLGLLQHPRWSTL